MEQRCEIILQNYLKTQVYTTDYKIIKNYIYNNIIKYNNIILFYVANNTNYRKNNICNELQKVYDYNNYFYYFNNKNNKICFYKNLQIKVICNDKEEKYYNKFCKIYRKIIKIYKKFAYFKYYYKKNQFFIYTYKKTYYYNIKYSYSNNYSIMFLLYIIFVYMDQNYLKL